MARILVTGGNGVLGRQIVAKLSARYTVRVMSRRPARAAVSMVEWAQADLETGDGLKAALADVSAIIHAASNPFKHSRQVDVNGTRRLMEQARTAKIAHVIYISIVGIDRIPYPYYQLDSCELADYSEK